MHFSSVAFSHTGEVRAHNEDACIAIEDVGLWLVADGMGGYQAGDVASRLICDTLSGECATQGDAFDHVSLEDAIRLANDKIRRYGRDVLNGDMVGSTLVALLIRDGRFHLYWAGDSRCYRLRDRVLTQVTRDHSQVADLVDQGLIAESEAEHHPLAHVITRALGVEDEIELDYLTGAVTGGDCFLLCSDGVSKELSLAELEAFLNGGAMHEVSQAIMHSLLIKKCNDNITSIIVKVFDECRGAIGPDDGDDRTIPVDFRVG